MSFANIGYDHRGECGDRVIKWLIYVGAHKFKNHKFGVTGYITNVDKICTYIIPKYVNYGRNHQTIAFKCLARPKAQAKF